MNRAALFALALAAGTTDFFGPVPFTRSPPARRGSARRPVAPPLPGVDETARIVAAEAKRARKAALKASQK